VEILSILSRYIFFIIFIAIWVAIPVFLYYSYQNKRRREWIESQEYTLIKISVPKENEKGPLSAEQMFASLHGIFKPNKERVREGSLQEHISFEIVSSKERISFFVWLPTHLKDFVEGQIYAQYSKVEFEVISDYASNEFSDYQIIGTNLVLNKNDVLPIKTFLNFEEVDPLSGITSVLSKINDPEDQIWIQILFKPVDDIWQERGIAYVNAVREGHSPDSRGFGLIIKDGAVGFTKELLKAAVAPPETLTQPAAPVKVAPGDEAKVKAIEEKIAKLGFGVKIRIGYISKKSDLNTAKIKLKSVVSAFKQFNTVNLNGFQAGSSVAGDQFVKDYRSRLFTEEGFVLNIEELASIFHLPNISVETPNIDWTGSKKGEPPENLPVATGADIDKEISVFAETNFRHKKEKFGVKEDDRRRHMYIIGKTGVGKTNMMENMVISDINAGHGVAVVDPHGEFVDKILQYIPKNRINDVVLFNPADIDHPVAFNPLETVSADQKNLVASGLISIFQKIWQESWGPRLEYILRNTIISLLDYPDSTMFGILRILVDNEYRKKVVKSLNDPVIHDFWTKEFAQYNEKTRVDAILPIQNKVGQFLSSPTIRNIVGQPKSKIDIRKIMDNKKILLLRLAQGQIGEDNAALLGAMMITKMQLTAMSRVDVLEEKRNDFYLYVDEFQNFATESFAKILSEARKYRLNLILANQYIAQLSEPVRDAIFGNAGSLVCFRVGATDSLFLDKELEPVFDANDLVNLDKYQVYVKLSVDGVTGNAFSAKTLKIPEPTDDNVQTIIRTSQERYATDREFVEQKISEWAASNEKENNLGAENGQNVQETQVNNYQGYGRYLQEIKENISKKPVESMDDQQKLEESVSKIETIKQIDKNDINGIENIPTVKSEQIKKMTSKIIQSRDINKSEDKLEINKKILTDVNQVSRPSEKQPEINNNELIYQSFKSDTSHIVEETGDSKDEDQEMKKEIKPGEIIKFD